VDRAAQAERKARERAARVDVENAAMLASAHEDAKGLVQKIMLVEGKLVEEGRA
jgi:hypothetical protein